MQVHHKIVTGPEEATPTGRAEHPDSGDGAT